MHRVRFRFGGHGSWLEWKAGVSTQTPEKLFVKDLGLKEGEYVTAIAMAYGDVDKGFYTGSKWAMIPSDQWYNEKYAGKRCRDFYYGVKATESLEPVGGAGEEPDCFIGSHYFIHGV